MEAVAVHAVTKTFGDARAVDGLNLSVPRGAVFGLLGPNGSGKTTTIRMILQIILPDEGSIEVLGAPLDEKGKQRIGYLPEERGLYRGMTVGDQLVFFGQLRGLSASAARDRSHRWLERFDAVDWFGRKVQELSKGMQQKVQFIGTILHDPDLVILDEPFSGLDPVNTRLLKDVMLELRDRGCTVIFSTHQMEQVERSCDSICLMNKGRAVVQGEVAAIRRDHGANTVHVEYAGNLPRDRIAPLTETLDDHGHYAEIRLRSEEDASPLLRILVDSVDVRRFETSEASMHDIFIRLVEEKR
ncbi:MAG: ATP-binding cassette domain-containing protein [Candidatus Eisenbacteria bacterium]|nr:ATP-binding cassette domain-containing protein [Candidatus Latescibacterota bacterium]MBD3301526.1 ATP-binding cassette domain-containing protein [Candidatus Eisenbacteria bacterium]